MEHTSITISRESAESWERFRHPGESTEDMVNRILRYVAEEDEQLLTSQDLAEMESSIADREGHRIQAQMKEEYGL